MDGTGKTLFLPLFSPRKISSRDRQIPESSAAPSFEVLLINQPQKWMAGGIDYCNRWYRQAGAGYELTNGSRTVSIRGPSTIAVDGLESLHNARANRHAKRYRKCLLWLAICWKDKKEAQKESPTNCRTKWLQICKPFSKLILWRHKMNSSAKKN